MTMLRWVAFSVIVLSLLGAGLFRSQQRAKLAPTQSILPQARLVVPTPSPTPPPPIDAPKPTAQVLPAKVDLPVPFTPQAPHANWKDPYTEFCEEASVFMAISYLQNKKIPDKAFADSALQDIKKFEEKRFGFYKDTTAEETAVILREHFAYKKVTVKYNPTVTEIKQALAERRVVITPVAGREIYNPYFQTPGPLYHMLVIKGYTDTGKFITNDPGTRHGADFLYDESIIMNAIHDWRTDGNIDLGKKVVIIAG